MTTTNYHLPVLPRQTLELWLSHPGGVYVDATFGGGGHSSLLLEKLNPEGRLFAFDQDADAANNAPEDSRFTLVPENFRHLKEALADKGVFGVQGILADLGVSSHQFDTPERGFSFRFDGPLDMRMQQTDSPSAADLLNTLPEEALANLLYQYGELHNSRRLARALVGARPLHTTQVLRETLSRFAPPQKQNKLYAQVFQALRIAVNDELGALEALLEQSLEVLAPGGRLVVMSYHSLEDRRVKHFLKTGNLSGQLEKDFYGNPLTPWRLLTNRAIIADDREVDENPRARSAKLRAAEKLPSGKSVP